jgi:hypothetical protein
MMEAIAMVTVQTHAPSQEQRISYKHFSANQNQHYERERGLSTEKLYPSIPGADLYGQEVGKAVKSLVLEESYATYEPRNS